MITAHEFRAYIQKKMVPLRKEIDDLFNEWCAKTLDPCLRQNMEKFTYGTVCFTCTPPRLPYTWSYQDVEYARTYIGDRLREAGYEAKFLSNVVLAIELYVEDPNAPDADDIQEKRDALTYDVSEPPTGPDDFGGSDY